MLLTLYTLIIVLLLFGVTIFVHELGHFLVARWCGLTVEVFSIGFGPALWKKEVRGVVYKIGILPLGGYVALPQMDPGGGEAPQTREGEALPSVAPWKKIVVASAGVTCNMVLAYFIAHVVYWGGQSYAPSEQGALVGFVETNSTAYAEGIRIGDKMLSVNGEAVGSWDDFQLTVAFYEQVDLEVESPDGGVRTVRLDTEQLLGAYRVPGLAPLNYCYVLQVQPGTSAEEAGLQSGDRVVTLGGVKLYSRDHMQQVVDQHRDQRVVAEVERDGGMIELQVQPRFNEEANRALIGIQFNTLDVKKPWQQIKSHSGLIFRFLRALVTPKKAKEAARNVGGPVAILTIIWVSVQSDIILALWFTGLLNVNLAILNLLPIPVLDGGHIIFASLEAIRRKPVSAKLVALVSNACAVLLIGLFLFLSYRDVLRLPMWWGGGSGTEAPAATNAPATGSSAE